MERSCGEWLELKADYMGLFENNVNNGMLLIGTFLRETDFKEITMTFESLTGYLKISRDFCECIPTNHIILRD